MAHRPAPMKRIYWFHELPPLRDEIAGEYEIEAESDPVHNDFAERDHLWAQCIDSLKARLDQRLHQELERLHGHCVQILEEQVTPKIDAAAETYRLHGRYTYVLFKEPADPAPES